MRKYVKQKAILVEIEKEQKLNKRCEYNKLYWTLIKKTLKLLVIYRKSNLKISKCERQFEKVDRLIMIGEG